MVPMAIAIMEITVQITLVIPVSIAARKGRTTANLTGIVNAKVAVMNLTAGTADPMKGITEDTADGLPFLVGGIDISPGNYPYANPANAGFFLDLSAPACRGSTFYIICVRRRFLTELASYKNLQVFTLRPLLRPTAKSNRKTVIFDLSSAKPLLLLFSAVKNHRRSE